MHVELFANGVHCLSALQKTFVNKSIILLCFMLQKISVDEFGYTQRAKDNFIASVNQVSLMPRNPKLIFHLFLTLINKFVSLYCLLIFTDILNMIFFKYFSKKAYPIFLKF